MILESFRRRFTAMKNAKNNISICLDIGAYHGDFTRTLLTVWPKAKVFQIEADDRNRPFLNSDAIFSLLGKHEDDNVNFYTLADGITTGSSIYKELTPYYDDSLIMKKKMVTLDSLDVDFSGDWSDSGLIKLDTQGSELDILFGASFFLEEHNPRYILVECSVTPYNKDAPLINEVIETLNNMEYVFRDVMDLQYTATGQLFQTDILFEREF